MLEIQKSGDKTSSGEIGLDIRTHASPKVVVNYSNLDKIGQYFINSFVIFAKIRGFVLKNVYEKKPVILYCY